MRPRDEREQALYDFIASLPGRKTYGSAIANRMIDDARTALAAFDAAVVPEETTAARTPVVGPTSYPEAAT
jgi:hypothetical protein